MAKDAARGFSRRDHREAALAARALNFQHRGTGYSRASTCAAIGQTSVAVEEDHSLPPLKIRECAANAPGRPLPWVMASKRCNGSGCRILTAAKGRPARRMKFLPAETRLLTAALKIFVQEAIIYEGYNDDTHANDVILIKLNARAPGQDHSLGAAWLVIAACRWSGAALMVPLLLAWCDGAYIYSDWIASTTPPNQN